MAAARFNTRFALILIAAIVVVAGTVGGLAVLRMRADAERHIRAGDELMQEGKYAEALSEYGRAVSKKPKNVAYLDKMQGALTSIVPKNQEETRSLLKTFQGIQDTRAAINPGQGQSYVPLLDFSRARAEAYDNADAWSGLEQHADRMVKALEERDLQNSDLLYPRGRLERGAAAVRRTMVPVGSVQLTPEEQAEAVEDLVAVAEQFPDEAYALLATLAMNEGERARVRGESETSRKKFAESDEYLRKGLAATGGKGPRLLTAKLLRLYGMGNSAPITEISQTADALINAVRTTEDANILLAAQRVAGPVAMLVDSATGKRVGGEMIGIMKSYTERHPENLMVRSRYAEVLQENGDPEGAIVEGMAVIEYPQLPFSIDAAIQRDRQGYACAVVLESLMRRYAELVEGQESTPESQAKAAETLKQHQAVRDRLVAIMNNDLDTLPVLKTDGDYAFVQGQYEVASEKYQNYLSKLPLNVPPPAHVLDRAFMAAAASRQLQVAANHYEQFSRVDPSRTLMRRRAFEAAQVYESLGRLEAAEAAVALALQENPDSGAVRAVEARIKSKRASATEESLPGVLRQLGQLFTSGELDAGREAAQEAIKKYPDDAAVRRALVMIEIGSGKFESARGEAERALSEVSDIPSSDRSFFESVVQNLGRGEDDPVKVTENIAEVLASRVDSPDQREQVRLRMLIARLGRMKVDLAGAERAGNVTEATALRDQVARLETIVAARRAALESIEQTPAVLDARLRAAQAAEDVQSMAKVIADAEKLQEPLDPITLVIWKASLEALRARVEAKPGTAPNLQPAERIVEAGIQKYQRSPRLLEALAEIRRLRGDRFGAIELYRGVVDQLGPTSEAALMLAMLQNEAGDRAGSLATLRRFVGERRLADVEVPVREQLLQLEADVGNRNEALRRRMQLERTRSNDLMNRVGLASLLLSTTPDRLDVLNPNGSARFDEPQWNQLRREDVQRELQAVRRSWQAHANEIIADLLQQSRNDDRAALGAAQLLQQVGRLDDAKRVLRERIDRAGADATAGMWVDLGRVAVASRDAETASEAFTRALELQNPQTREVDRELARLFMALAVEENPGPNFQTAEKHLRSVLDGNPGDRQAMIDLAQCLLQRVARQAADVRALDEAEQVLTRALANGDDPQALLLKAQLELMRAEQTARTGTVSRDETWTIVVNAVNRARPILAAARQAQGNSFNANIPATEARMLYGAWATAPNRDTNETAQRMMTEADAVLDEALARQPDSWELVALKQQLRIARQDFAGAKAALLDYVRDNPGNGQARQTLISLLVQTRDLTRAIQVARDAADRNPGSADWLLVMHDIAWNNARQADAITYAEEAYRIEPERTAPFIVGSLINRGFGRDFERVVEIAREQPSAVEAQPYVLGARGAALVRTGRRDQGVEDLKTSYQRFRAQREAAMSQGGTPQSMTPWFTLARIAFAGDPAEVQKLADACRNGAPPTGDEMRAMAGIWAQRADTDSRNKSLALYGSALAALEQEGAPAAERASLLFEFGTTQYLAGDCTRAIERYEQGLALVPDQPQPALHNNIAYLYYQCLNDPARGITHARRAVLESPGNPQFLDTLGELSLRLYQKTKDQAALEEAERRLTQALTVGNLHASRVNMAEVFVERGDSVRASALLRELLNDTSTPPELLTRVKGLQERLATSAG